jgi:dynein heavy chain
VQLDDKHLLIFGGLNKRQRYNDVWVLNWESKEWTKVTPAGAAPEERAHFTATKFGNRIFIFGGYGGSGQVFNDMWLLHFDMAEGSYAWENISDSIGGVMPTPRFDHCAFIYPITPNSSSYDKLLIMGGRDLSTMFSDSHMLDLNTMHWEETQPPTLPYEVRMAAAAWWHSKQSYMSQQPCCALLRHYVQLALTSKPGEHGKSGAGIYKSAQISPVNVTGE